MLATPAFLDPALPGAAWAQRLDARAKLLTVLCFVLAVNVSPVQAWPVQLVYLLALLLALFLARLPARRVLKRSLLAAPFLVLALLGTPFLQQGHTLWSVRVLGARLVLTDTGLWRLASVGLKSWLSLLAVVALSLTATFPELVQALQRLGLPNVLTSVLLLMYRYLFVLADEAQRLTRARDARTGQAPHGSRGRSLRWRAGVTGRLVGTLFLRTLERGERIYQAMLARGFDGTLHSLSAQRLRSRHTLLTALLLATFAALAVLANLGW